MSKKTLAPAQNKARQRAIVLAETIELMAIRGWTKTDLAAKIGVTDSCVYAWLSKERYASKVAAKVIHALLEEARADAEKKVTA